METPICPFFREKCLLGKCAAFRETTDRIYLALYHIYDKKKKEKAKKLQRKWIGSKFLGFGDRYKDIEVEVEITMCHIIKEVEVRWAKCSTLNIDFGSVIWEEWDMNKWREMNRSCLSVEQLKAKEWLKTNH